MGCLAKLVNTKDKIESFKKQYNFPEDVQVRYVSQDDLALLQYQDLVLLIISIIEGGVRIPMHPFLIQFLTHYRLNPLQCVPNVFRIVMGTAVLNDKLNLNLIVHDIAYVYRLQEMGKKKYTLVARNSQPKLVTGLPNSSKDQDVDFLVITGNWCDPLFDCPLTPRKPGFHHYTFKKSPLFLDSLSYLCCFFLSDKEFTENKVKFVERKTVEHLLKIRVSLIVEDSLIQDQSRWSMSPPTIRFKMRRESRTFARSRSLFHSSKKVTSHYRSRLNIQKENPSPSFSHSLN